MLITMTKLCYYHVAFFTKNMNTCPRNVPPTMCVLNILDVLFFRKLPRKTESRRLGSVPSKIIVKKRSVMPELEFPVNNSLEFGKKGPTSLEIQWNSLGIPINS